MADLIDQRLSAELAHARRLEATDADVDAVLARLNAPARRRRPLFGRASTIAVVIALGTVTAASATGIAILAREQPSGKSEPQLTTPTYIVAQGSTPQFGAWRMLLTGSDQGDCIGLQLLQSATASESAPIMESCGGRKQLTVAVYRDASATLVYGRAPGGTREVRIDAPGRQPTRVQANDSERGAFYVAELTGHPAELRATADTPAGPKTAELTLD